MAASAGTGSTFNGSSFTANAALTNVGGSFSATAKFGSYALSLPTSAYVWAATAAPQVATPAQHVAIAAYNDETHVEENRRLYREKFAAAMQLLIEELLVPRLDGA